MFNHIQAIYICHSIYNSVMQATIAIIKMYALVLVEENLTLTYRLNTLFRNLNSICNKKSTRVLSDDIISNFVTYIRAR